MTEIAAAVLAALDAGREAAESRLLEWLRIPSVSAQPQHAGDCARAARWLRDELAALGFDAAVVATPGHPMVLAQHAGPGGDAPHLLYYGHYDVQPAEPFELWSSPPFEPVVVHGPRGRRVVARGAVDDKGQVRTWMEAFRAWRAVSGGIPARVTVLVEGEEEMGSPNLDAFLTAHAAELAADVAVISDTNQWDFDTPALSTRLRGLVYVQIDLTTGTRDLHSGMYGGSAANPCNLLARVLAALHDEDGRVTIPGFYDGVAELDPATRAVWDGLGFDEAAFLGDVGLSMPAGERGRGALERIWARPTCDVNGIWGGYMGAGAKTVIANSAHAKVSFRLVPEQQPGRIVAALRAFLAARLPVDGRAAVQVFGSSPGILVPEDSRWMRAAADALAAEFGRPAVPIGCGGSIPVVESLQRILGLDTVLMGFGLDDDQVHSPDEKFELACLHRGARSHARLLGRLASG